MKVLGLLVPFTRQTAPLTKAANLSSVAENRGWFRIFESWPGAWQHNVTIDRNLVLTQHAVYSCMTLIAADISKLRVKLVEQDAAGVWSETTNPAYSPVLRKPNPWQNRIQFFEAWVLSKLSRGNAYILKQRDGRGVVIGLYVLDPQRVVPMVADDGSIFYKLSADNLSGLTADIMVPAREIIHDRMNCLFHPLVGTSPIYAAGLAATQGLNIQTNSANFFGNRSQPGGVLTAPGAIAQETADRLKESWSTNFSGENAGKVAVLGDGLKYERMTLTAEESQLIDQLKWSAEVVCSTFHVPPYKIGVGQMPTYNNIQSLNVEYYSQCLQSLIESIELCLDEGLAMAPKIGTEFDLDGLLRMDGVSQIEYLDKAKSVMTLDERRRRLDLKALPVGGDTVYLQQQDHSIEAIAARDRLMIAGPPPPVVPANDDEAVERATLALFEKDLREALNA